MLRENPQQRPNIYEVIRDVSRMRGTEVPIKDVGLNPSHRIPMLTPGDLCWADSIGGSKESAFALP